MQYKVVEWAYGDPNVASCFASTYPSDAIKQAIINNIRENGYMIDSVCHLNPVLNTGEIVKLDNDLKRELLSKAYRFDENTINCYFDYISFNPFCDLTNPKKFSCDFPVKRIVWVKNDAFDSLKNSIINGNSNVDIIPDDYINLKSGDFIQYTTEDEEKHFDVKVKYFISGSSLLEISDIRHFKKPTTKDIINHFQLIKSHNEIYNQNEKLLYRYEGLTGEQIYQEFKRVYGILLLELISYREFNCKINLIVFEKNTTFEPTILQMPEETPLKDDIMNKINDAYNAVIEEQNRRKEDFNNKVLRLKEKMAQRKKNN